jgi:hypothetical protein
MSLKGLVSRSSGYVILDISGTRQSKVESMVVDAGNVGTKNVESSVAMDV